MFVKRQGITGDGSVKIRLSVMKASMDYCCCDDGYDAAKCFSRFRQTSFSVIAVIMLAVLLSLHWGLTVIFTCISLGRVTCLPLGSAVVGCHLLASGQACSAAFPLRMMDQLCLCDSVPRAPLFRAYSTTGRWGWGLGWREKWLHEDDLEDVWRDY